VTFTWRRTFPDTHHDFAAEDAGQHVGRIKRIDGRPQNGTWSRTGCQRGHEAEDVRPLNGLTAARDEAIEAMAAAWGRAKAWSADRVAAGLTQAFAANLKISEPSHRLARSGFRNTKDRFLRPARSIGYQFL
jgi:hypothetical protein